MRRFIKSSLTKLLKNADQWKEELGNMQCIINNTIPYHSIIEPVAIDAGLISRKSLSVGSVKKFLAEIGSSLKAERYTRCDKKI